MVLFRLQEAGLRPEREKCTFRQKSCQCMRHEIDIEGIHPTNDKDLAIENAPEPQTAQEPQLLRLRARPLLSQLSAKPDHHFGTFKSIRCRHVSAEAGFDVHTKKTNDEPGKKIKICYYIFTQIPNQVCNEFTAYVVRQGAPLVVRLFCTVFGVH